MTTAPKLLDRITDLVTRAIDESTGRTVSLAPDDPLISSGYLDSMSMVNLVIAMQSELAITLDVADMSADNFATIRSIVKLVETRLPGE